MNYKTCNKCNNILPATTNCFHVQKRGMYGLISICKKCVAEKFKTTYIPIPKKTEKVCGHCKETFPLTGEYFFTKITKAGTIVSKTGKPISKDCIVFRSICKKCHNIQDLERKHKKVMFANNLSTLEDLKKFQKNNFIQGNLKRRKYSYPQDLPEIKKEKYRKIIKLGFDPETYDTEWKKQWLEKTKANRKYKYPVEYDVVPRSVINKHISEIMTDGFIANRLGFKLEDIPQEIIELKRKQLKFYRDVKNKKDENRNNF